MRVNSKCAHQVRPPLELFLAGRCLRRSLGKVEIRGRGWEAGVHRRAWAICCSLPKPPRSKIPFHAIHELRSRVASTVG